MAASSSASHCGIGPRLKEFVFTDKLGSGTYATVYKAYKKTGKREVVAIKCVQKSSLNRASTENLLTEIELLKTLKHEHIVQLKDFQWDNEYIYLIMEYCSGGDLLQFIQLRRCIPEHIVKRFLQQLALALKYMREKNVSHMDLKPQNILLTSKEDPALKIGDFGFATYLIGETQLYSLRGSPLYMAPEIIIKRHYSEKVDLWSLGVIMYECLFGRAPFASKSLKGLEEKIKDTRPVEIPSGVQISDSCRHLLHGLLERDPENRLSFDMFFAHSFVDLAHVPSDQSLPAAISLVQEAVDKDTAGDPSSAVHLYLQALSHFVPAIHFEKNPNKKKQLRAKVREYMARAEELKAQMSPSIELSSPRSSGTTNPLSQNMPVDNYLELLKLTEENQHMQIALKLAKTAERKECGGEYREALEKYELALGRLIKFLPEQTGRRKELLQAEVARWMRRAELVKDHIKMQDLKGAEVSVQEEQEDSQSLGQQCLIQ